MLLIYVFVSAFHDGVAGGLYMSARGGHARLIIAISVVYLLCLYLCKWQKICHKTYRILVCMVAFMILMFLGCHLIPWWNVWMAIPLTVIWYPIHCRILDGLPHKEDADELCDKK